MTDTKHRNTLKMLTQWVPNYAPNQSTLSKARTIAPLSNEVSFNIIHHDKLQQGALYIIKIKQVSLAMFEGWNDDMCCFSILRSEVEPMRWSEARQLPGDFDIYDAFDECGNPPIHLWARNLRVNVPNNWFSMFEEAKRKQKSWGMHKEQAHSQQEQEQEQDHCQQPAHNNESMPASANADVSLMHLNGNTTTSPSIVASTNVVDPSLLNEDNQSTTTEAGGSQYQASATTDVMTLNPDHINIRATMPRSPSDRSSSIMNRNQIRRHLAPDQTTVSNSDHRSTNEKPLDRTGLTVSEKKTTRSIHRLFKRPIVQPNTF